MWTFKTKPYKPKGILFKQDSLTYTFTCITLYLTSILCLIGLSWNIGYTAPKQSSLSIKVIEASVSKTKNAKVDPQLLKLKKSLVKSFPKLTHFKFLQDHKIKVVQGQKKKLSVTSDLEVKLTLLRNREKRLIFQMEVPKKKASFKLKAQKGRLFYQAMRWKSKVYILAFKAK
jgi:hypothetical protein